MSITRRASRHDSHTARDADGHVVVQGLAARDHVHSGRRERARRVGRCALVHLELRRRGRQRRVSRAVVGCGRALVADVHGLVSGLPLHGRGPRASRLVVVVGRGVHALGLVAARARGLVLGRTAGASWEEQKAKWGARGARGMRTCAPGRECLADGRTGRQALEARVLELEMRVPNLVALQERIDNVELSIARLAAIEEQVASGSKLSSRRMS